MILGGDKATYVCEVSGAASNEEHQADARLIAAAPELLGNLKTAADLLHIFADTSTEDLQGHYKAIRAAIAKAEGRDA
jgi:hypothetical protein